MKHVFGYVNSSTALRATCRRREHLLPDEVARDLRAHGPYLVTADEIRYPHHLQTGCG